MSQIPDQNIEHIALTCDKKPELLLVLENPELPLHNNPAELGACQRVANATSASAPAARPALLPGTPS